MRGEDDLGKEEKDENNWGGDRVSWEEKKRFREENGLRANDYEKERLKLESWRAKGLKAEHLGS